MARINQTDLDAWLKKVKATVVATSDIDGLGPCVVYRVAGELVFAVMTTDPLPKWELHAPLGAAEGVAETLKSAECALGVPPAMLTLKVVGGDPKAPVYSWEDGGMKQGDPTLHEIVTALDGRAPKRGDWVHLEVFVERDADRDGDLDGDEK
jgi:hypothetical protein